MRITWSALIVVLVVATGCSHLPVSRDVRLTPQQRANCEAQGGIVERVLTTMEACVRPTSDGGKSCTDNSQCEGACVAPAGTAKDAIVTGACATEVGRMGCLNAVLNGKATGEACFN